MAKRKRKEPEAAQVKADAHEPPITTPAETDGQAPPTVEKPAEPPAQRRPAPHVESKPRSVIGRYFKDRRVELIDDGNAGGVGIKLSYDDPAERPSDAVKQILKEGDEQRPGFTYQGGRKQWHKRIGADAVPRTAVAIRLDAERRVEAIGEQMTHEERLKAERERGGVPGDKAPD